MALSGKKIILGVTGGIAAYKSVELVSQLKKLNVQVHVILTSKAEKFVSAFSLGIMSGNNVLSEQNKENEIEHIKLSEQADLILVAPATANSIAKLSAGISDELLYDTILATKAPIFIAPAMNSHMWDHPSTKKNLEQLIDYGYHLIDPDYGDLACGYHGTGRLASLEKIIHKLENHFASQAQGEQIFENKKITITVGATREPVDPVRYITNRSSGKMGLALTEALLKAGARVDLISTLENHNLSHSNLNIISVETADQMFEKVKQSFLSDHSDALLMVAAVGDFKIKNHSQQKIKKSHNFNHLELENNLDILQEIKTQKKSHQVVIGFSVETENAIKEARRKLTDKGLDYIVINSPEAFGSDNSSVIILQEDNEITLTNSSKKNIAEKIVELLCLRLKQKQAVL